MVKSPLGVRLDCGSQYVGVGLGIRVGSLAMFVWIGARNTSGVTGKGRLDWGSEYE